MKQETKIFITCLVGGLYVINLGVVDLRGVTGMTLNSAAAVGGIAIGLLLWTYGILQKGDS